LKLVLHELTSTFEAGQAYRGQGEAFEMIRDLQVQVSFLRQQHDEFGAQLASKDSQMALFFKPHFADFQKSLQQQAILQAEVVEFLQRRHEDFRTGVAMTDSQRQLTQQEDDKLEDQLEDQLAIVQEYTKELERMELETVKEHAQKEKAALAALDAASKVHVSEAPAMQQFFEQRLQEHGEGVKLLSIQGQSVKPGLTSVQHSPPQELAQMPNDEDNARQPSLQVVEQAEDTDLLHGESQQAERDNRIRDDRVDLKVQAAIRDLHQELSQLSQDLKCHRGGDRVATSSNSSCGGSLEAGIQGSLVEPCQVKGMEDAEVAEYPGVADPLQWSNVRASVDV